MGQAMHVIAALAWLAVAELIASAGDQIVTLAVALIGAAASIAAAVIARGAKREAHRRRVVVTHHADEDAVTVSNESRRELGGDDGK